MRIVIWVGTLRCFSRVYDDDSLWVVDYPSVYWQPLGPFEQSYKLTQAGDVLIVPTPGHTPGHVSVLVNTEDVIFFLAGDTSYSESLLIKRTPDGVSPRASVAVDTMDRILRLADSRPLVYLPSHDPESVDRLTEKRTLGESLTMPTLGGAYA